ncbi:helix-turn-helix domain-containing protein [Solidesulfovibrio sp. C21]|uniref:helix-turn-helix domain-containing protein n=1 Tax=Solidesulfovibrio sp. C21 TaxID=3398613 RepID=UPI0039FD5CD5
MDFEIAMERIQSITGSRTQTELGNILGIKQSSISDAKRRQVIPDGWLVTLYRRYGANPSWILGEAESPYLVEGHNQETPTSKINATPAPLSKQKSKSTTRELLEALRAQLGDAFEVVIVPAGTTITIPHHTRTPIYTNEDDEVAK